jgi:tetratricopeptide (TPR) repeat protein
VSKFPVVDRRQSYFCDRKTRIALEFATKAKDSGAFSVFWIHAGSAERVEKAYTDIARKAHIPGWDSATSNKLQLVKDWLEEDQCGQWLMIIDNADDIDLFYGTAEDRMAKYLPKSNSGSILLTSRDRRIGLKFTGASNIFSLEALATTSSAKLLEARLGESDTSSADDRIKLAETLENIPLALIQASAYISSNMISIDEYLDLYRGSDASKMELLSEAFEDDIRDGETVNPIATTWAISFEQIRQRYTQAAGMLSMMSMFDPQAIPRSLLEGQTDRKTFLESIATLKGFSLISERRPDKVHAQPGSYGITKEALYDLHRLVRLAMRGWLKLAQEFDSWAARAFTRTSKIYPEGNFEHREIWTAYLPHAITLFANISILGHGSLSNIDIVSLFQDQALQTTHAPEDKLCARCTSQLLYNVSWSFYTRGQNSEALVFAQKGWVLRNITFGPEHIDTVRSFNQVGSNMRSLGQFADAEKHYRSALDPEKFLADTANISPSNMSSVMKKEGSSVLPNPGHDTEVVGGSPTPPRSAGKRYSYYELERDLANATSLSWVYLRWGRLREAEELEARASYMRRNISGTDHPETLRSMNSLARIYLSQGRYEESISIAKQVAEGREAISGDKHPETMRSRAVLNTNFNAIGRPQEVLRSGVLENQLAMLGEQHPDTIRSMTDYGVAYSNQGNYSEEARLMEQARKNTKSVRSPLHPDYHVTKVNVEIARARGSRSFLSKAVSETKMLKLQTSLLGPTHPNTMRTSAYLAYSYGKLGRFEEQESIVLQTLEARKEMLGAKHPDTLGSIATLAGIWLRQDRCVEGEALAKEAWAGFQETLGPKHHDTQSTMGVLGRIYSRRGKYSDARSLQLQLLQLRQETLAYDFTEVVATARELAATCKLMGQIDEAETYETQANNLEEKARISSTCGVLCVLDHREDWECSLHSGRGELMN